MKLITTERKLKIIATLLSIGMITVIFLWITTHRIHRIQIEKLNTENQRHKLTRQNLFTNNSNLRNQYYEYYESRTK